MFEGDIKLSPEQKKAIEKQRRSLEGSVEKRMIATAPRAQHWPVGQSIPYELDATLSRGGRRAINAAIQYIQRYTCVQFHEKRPTDRDYINFFRGTGYAFFTAKLYRFVVAYHSPNAQDAFGSLKIPLLSREIRTNPP